MTKESKQSVEGWNAPSGVWNRVQDEPMMHWSCDMTNINVYFGGCIWRMPSFLLQMKTWNLLTAQMFTHRINKVHIFSSTRILWTSEWTGLWISVFWWADIFVLCECHMWALWAGLVSTRQSFLSAPQEEEVTSCWPHKASDIPLWLREKKVSE